MRFFSNFAISTDARLLLTTAHGRCVAHSSRQKDQPRHPTVLGRGFINRHKPKRMNRPSLSNVTPGVSPGPRSDVLEK